MPVCVMDGTDVETVVVTSEWTEIELHANQTGENTSEDGDHSPPAADCNPRSSGNTEESEIQAEENQHLGESALTHNKHDGSVGCTEQRTAEAEQLEHNAKEGLSLSCSVTPPPHLDSTLTVPVTAPDGAAVFSILTGTRRSARTPKKTWKLKSVNLQKQKRKPGVVTGQKRERKPLAPVRNSGTVTEIEGERIAADNGLVHGFH